MTSESENLSTSSRSSSLSRWGPVLIVFAALAVYLFVSRPAGALEGWSEDYNAALVQAKETDRQLLLYFHTDFCAPCSAMERSVLGQPEVVAALKGFIPVRLDAARRADLANSFGVYGPPSFVVSSPIE